MKRALRRAVERIASQYDDLEALAPLAGERVERVSGWSVGQHVEHLLKADATILRYFPAPDDPPFPPITPLGRFILLSGWIPRGKGKAPSATQPEAPSPESLLAQLAEIRSLFADVIAPAASLLEPQPIAKHPYFGGFNRAQWLRWVVVHHHHHAKIVRDVLRADPA